MLRCSMTATSALGIIQQTQIHKKEDKDLIKQDPHRAGCFFRKGRQCEFEMGGGSRVLFVALFFTDHFLMLQLSTNFKTQLLHRI